MNVASEVPVRRYTFVGFVLPLASLASLFLIVALSFLWIAWSSIAFQSGPITLGAGFLTLLVLGVVLGLLASLAWFAVFVWFAIVLGRAFWRDA